MSKYYEDILIESMRLHSADDRPKKRRLKESFGNDPYTSEDDDHYMGEGDTYTGIGGEDTYIGTDGEDTYTGVDESLTEARNPENDEVNELIKKASYSGKLGKRTEQALAQYGIKADHNRMALVGPNGRAIRLGYPRRGVPQPQRDADWSGMFGSTSEKHFMGKPGRVDNFDYLNYLTVDREFDEPGKEFYSHDKIKNPGEDTDIRHNFSVVDGSDLGYEDRRSPESKSLRPYSDEYKVRAGERQRAQDKANAAKQELKQKNKDLKKFIADAKTRKNESLSLKEEKNKEVDEYISKLLNKIKDSGLQQVIRDAIFRGNVDKKFLLDTICQNMPEQKKEIEKLGLKESLSLKEGLRGSNLWGELFDEARGHIYDAICDTLNSIDWLDDDEIDIDDIFVSELSQQLASELCDTVDDMFGEIITR